MPNPSASSPDLPALHGHTHRPKALGGTDPIDFPTSSGGGLSTAIGRQFITTMTASITCKFSDIWWNDDSLFAYDFVEGSSPNKTARYITVNQDGTYLLTVNVFFNSDFTVGDSPFIRPLLWLPGAASANDLVNALGIDEVDDTQSFIAGEQLTAAEMDHHQLAANLTFGVHLADFSGETSIGFGVGLSAGGSRTKGFGAGIALTRLGDAPVEQTIT